MDYPFTLETGVTAHTDHCNNDRCLKIRFLYRMNYTTGDEGLLDYLSQLLSVIENTNFKPTLRIVVVVHDLGLKLVFSITLNNCHRILVVVHDLALKLVLWR